MMKNVQPDLCQIFFVSNILCFRYSFYSSSFNIHIKNTCNAFSFFNFSEFRPLSDTACNWQRQLWEGSFYNFTFRNKILIAIQTLQQFPFDLLVAHLFPDFSSHIRQQRRLTFLVWIFFLCRSDNVKRPVNVYEYLDFVALFVNILHHFENPFRIGFCYIRFFSICAFYLCFPFLR